MVKTLTSSSVAPKTLTASAVALRHGLYPPFYPGPTAFPGAGNDLSASAVVPKTLTETPA